MGKKENSVLIKYEGWSDKWNIWSDFTKELWRFYPYKSVSKLKARGPLKWKKEGDKIAFRCQKYHPDGKGWTRAIIRRRDRRTENSGWVQVQFMDQRVPPRRELLYWSHLDNNDEVRDKQYLESKSP